MCFYSVVKLFGGEESSWQKQVLKLSLCILRNKQLEMHIMNYNCFPHPPQGWSNVCNQISQQFIKSQKPNSFTVFLKQTMVKKKKKIKWNKYKIYTKYLCQIKVFKMLFLTHPPCPPNVSLFFLSFFHILLLIFTYLTITISSGVGNSVYIFKVRAWAPKTSVCSI